MKRKTKETTTDKRSQNTDSVAASKESEVMKLIKGLQNKIREQDKKINQLFKANKEFKNSVMALYVELEKAKDREKNVEKMIGNNQNNTKIELTSADKKISMGYNDFVKMFTNAAENFSQGKGGQPLNKNLFYVNSNDLNGLNQKFTPNAQKVFPYEVENCQQTLNPMIENGALSSPKNSIKAIKEEIKEGSIRNRRESKLLRSPSPSYNDTWKRVNGINSRPDTPKSLIRKDLISDNASDYSVNHYLGNPQILGKGSLISRSNSIISDFDDHKDKMMDNLSIYSNNAIQDFPLANPTLDKSIIQPNEIINPLKFETLSQGSKADISDLRSLSEFSSDNKLCGLKRKEH